MRLASLRWSNSTRAMPIVNRHLLLMSTGLGDLGLSMFEFGNVVRYGSCSALARGIRMVDQRIRLSGIVTIDDLIK